MFLEDELNNNQEEQNNVNAEQDKNINTEFNTPNNDGQEIEVVMGDDSNLEISIVGDLENDLKPKVQKRGNIVIPKPTVINNKSDNNIDSSQSNETKSDTDNNETNNE